MAATKIDESAGIELGPNFEDGHKDYHEQYIRAAAGNYQQEAYQVSVHLIEARGLSPNGGRRVLNPYAVISVCGRTQTTEIQRNTNNCLWDRRFSFPVIMLTEDEFQRENVYVQVFNANTFSRNDLIGQYAFQLSRIHQMKRDHFDASLFNHELYRKWVVLSNPAKPQLQQGFALLSVRVLKSGDSPPTHSSDYGNLYTAENAKGFNPLVPPTIKRTSYSLTLRIYRGQDVPVMDYFANSSDPFIVVKFNGIIVKTKVAKDTTDPIWNQGITIPVFTPCLSENIDIQLWDWSRMNPDELIATTRVKFSQLLTDPFGPMWVNFYGAPVAAADTGFWGWLGEVTPHLVGDAERDDTAYLGRALMSMRCEPDEYPEQKDVPIAAINEPTTSEYHLRMDLYEGCEIPCGWNGSVMVELCFGPGKNSRQSDWCKPVRAGPGRPGGDLGEHGTIRFTCGDYSPNSLRPKLHEEDEEDGASDEDESGGGRPRGLRKVCQFGDIRVQLPNELPSSTTLKQDQFYHVIINVYVKNMFGTKRVGYLRFSPFDCWTYDWMARPEWHMVRGIRDADGNVSAQSPGFLLFSCHFGRVPDDPTARKYFDNRPAMVRRNDGVFEKLFESYNLHAHIYQCRNLSPVLADGLTNAYVTVAVGGRNAYKPEILEKLENIGGGADSAAGPETKTGTSSKTSSAASSSSSSKGGGEKRLREDRDVCGTSVVEEEINPTYYEKLVTQKVRLPSLNEIFEKITKKNANPSDIGGRRNRGLARNIVVSVYHANDGENKKGTKKLIGRAYFPPWRCYGEENVFASGPKWLQLLPPDSLNPGDVPAVYDARGRKVKEAQPAYVLIRLGFNDYEADPSRPEVQIPNMRFPMRYAEWERKQVQKWLYRCRVKIGLFRLRNLILSYWGGLTNPTIQITAPRPANRKLIDMDSYKELKLMQDLADDEDDDTIVELMPHDECEDLKDPSFEKIFVPNPKTQSGDNDRLAFFSNADLQASSCPLILETIELDVMMPPPERKIQAPALTLIVRDGGSTGYMVCSATIPLWDYAGAVYDARPVDIADLIEPLPEFMRQYEVGSELDGKEGFGGNLLRKIMSKPRPVVEEGLKPTTDAKNYLVLDVRVLNKILMKEINDNHITNIEEETKLDKKFNIRGRDAGEEDTFSKPAISQYWPSEINTKETQQIDHKFVVREEWEKEKDFLPPLWFSALVLHSGPLKPVYSSWFKRTGGKRTLQQNGSVRGEAMVAIGVYSLDEGRRKETKQVLNQFARIQRSMDGMANKPPVSVEVRVYVKGVTGLLPSTEGNGKLNPFIKISIEGPHSKLPASRQAKAVFNDVSNAKEKTLNPHFYKMFQLEAEMPNRSILKVEICNRSFLLNSLIGETIIDLSDRWYNPVWKHRMASGMLPYENRTLTNPGSYDLPQGKIELCVHMYKTSEASLYDFIPISKQRPEPWELRIVVWDCEKVMTDLMGKENEKKPDLFFCVEYQCSDSDFSENIFPSKKIQESEVYYGAKAGRAEFNYRFKFPVVVPSTLPRLKVKVYERSWIGSNGYLAEANIELEPIFAAAARSMSRVDRERAEIKLYHPDFGKSVRGTVGMQLSLVTQDYAEENPVGYARDGPNNDPYLPPVQVVGETMLEYLLKVALQVFGGLICLGIVGVIFWLFAQYMLK
eukprot:g430.t1